MPLIESKLLTRLEEALTVKDRILRKYVGSLILVGKMLKRKIQRLQIRLKPPIRHRGYCKMSLFSLQRLLVYPLNLEKV